MKVIILCGGFGTRIRGVSDDIPKPMIPVGDKPILWHIMKYYAEFGYKEFILCIGYKGGVIKDFFLNYETSTRDFTVKLGSKNSMKFHDYHDEDNWEVTLADTGLNSMTGARVKKVQKYLSGEENFMLTYGDGVGNVDLKKLEDFHKSHGKILTVTGVRPPGRFGELNYNSEGKLLEFNEKPQSLGGRISGGFFVCRREIFDYMGDNEDLVFERERLESWLKKGR